MDTKALLWSGFKLKLGLVIWLVLDDKQLAGFRDKVG